MQPLRVNRLTLCQECHYQCLEPIIVLPVQLGAVFHYGEDHRLCRWWMLCHPKALELQRKSTWNWPRQLNEWCNFWQMKLNTSKTKTMIVCWSRTMHPHSPTLTVGGTVLKESDDLYILWVTFDSEMTFEKHHRSFTRADTQRRGLRKSGGNSMIDCFLWDAFLGFVLPVLEYCSAAWCWAADTQHKLLDRVVSGARFGVLFCSVVLGCRHPA